VVPIGDGLDYDVRETPEQVLAMLEGAPAAEVVPVPVPKSLTPMPADVSPEAEPAVAETANDATEETPPKRTPRTRKAKSAATSERPARKPRAKATKKVELALSDEQLEKLRKMAPGSLRKLTNTLATQFNVQDADQTIAALKERNVISVEHEHVSWATS